MGLLQARILECVEGIKYSKIIFMAGIWNSSVCSAQRSWAADCVCPCVCLPGCDSFSTRARRKGPSFISGSTWSREKGTGAGTVIGQAAGPWDSGRWVAGLGRKREQEPREPGNAQQLWLVCRARVWVDTLAKLKKKIIINIILRELRSIVIHSSDR